MVLVSLFRYDSVTIVFQKGELSGKYMQFHFPVL
jgi:hypothetical protein